MATWVKPRDVRISTEAAIMWHMQLAEEGQRAGLSRPLEGTLSAEVVEEGNLKLSCADGEVQTSMVVPARLWRLIS
jgi:hypothetical protein